MLITQFRKFTPINIALLCGMGIVLSVVSYVKLHHQIDLNLIEPFLEALLGDQQLIPHKISTNLSVLLALVFTLLQAFYLNRVSNLFKLYSKPNFLVACMFVTLGSAILPFLVLNQVLISNFIQIWMIYKLLRIYHLEKIYQDVFEIGMLVAVGSLIYFPFIGFFLAIWGALAIFRPFNWREWFVPFVGFVTVYFWVWVLCFWMDRTDVFSQIWAPLTSPELTIFSFEKDDYLIFIPLILLFVLFLNSLRHTLFKRIVHVRKSIQLMLFMLVLGVLSFGLDPHHLPEHFMICVPVLSLCSGYYFHYAEKKWIYECIYALLVLTIVYLQIV